MDCRSAVADFASPVGIMFVPTVDSRDAEQAAECLQKGEHKVNCVAAYQLKMPLLYRTPRQSCFDLQRSNKMRSAAKSVTVQSQVLCGVNILYWEAIGGRWMGESMLEQPLEVI